MSTQDYGWLHTYVWRIEYEQLGRWIEAGAAQSRMEARLIAEALHEQRRLRTRVVYRGRKSRRHGTETMPQPGEVVERFPEPDGPTS